jgi:predicted transcriptional regulator
MADTIQLPKETVTMATLAELTVQILIQRMAKKEMSLDEIQKEMVTISAMIKAIDEGTLQDSVAETAAEAVKPQKINLKQYFKKDEVICAICNKGFKTLKRHLTTAHAMKPGQYRKQFGIPSTLSLAAKSYVESRRQMALDKGLGAGLAKAREAKAAEAPAKQAKTAVPAVRKKAAVPAKLK